MANPVVVPRLGWTMEEGTFGGWLRSEGDEVRQGEALYTLESDKATEPVEAIHSGILRIPSGGPQVGDVVRVGDTLAYLVAPGETLPEPGAGATIGLAKTASVPTVQAQPTVQGVRAQPSARRRQLSSPRARRAARELGVDLLQISGSGRNGRIVARDVRAASTGKEKTERTKPISQARRLIAGRMLKSHTTTAPVTLTTKVDATEFRKLRQQLQSVNPGLGKLVPSYTDMMIKIAAGILKLHPDMAVRWHEDRIEYLADMHIAFAVDAPPGLVAPVVRYADNLTLDQITAETHAQIERVLANRHKAEELHGGVFTITNLGMHGIDGFTPLINLPDCAVLGMGRIVTEPAVWEGNIAARDKMMLSLTFDHRLVDGGPAARFLKELAQAVEQPFPWLLRG